MYVTTYRPTICKNVFIELDQRLSTKVSECGEWINDIHRPKKGPGKKGPGKNGPVKTVRVKTVLGKNGPGKKGPS